MKVIIAGSRYYDNYDELEKVCDYMLQNQTDIEIVSGDGQGSEINGVKKRGADQLGIYYAERRGYKITKFPANWKKFGKSAGPKRNKQMADYADALIAFWDGASNGTKSMIDFVKENNLKIKVHLYS